MQHFAIDIWILLSCLWIDATSGRLEEEEEAAGVGDEGRWKV